jgi:alkylation response protein AidB-like acyl-CoA dehydrogenase
MTALDAALPSEPAIATAARLGAEADQRWTELDVGCRLPSDLYRAALVAGLFRTLVPADMGGTGCSPVEWFRIGLELARNDPSLGWVVTQGAAELGWIAAGGDPDWATEVLGDPLGASASSVAGVGELKVNGSGSTLSGRWSFNTGCQDATWIGGLSMLAGVSNPDGTPAVRFAWVPAARATIVEDWDPTGMRGTGSHTTVIDEQAVEASWSLSPFDPTAHDRGPHRCLVGNGNWPIAGSVAATQLGAARRAIDEAAHIIATKAPAPTFVPLAENAAVQRTLIEAEGLWNACRSAVERELGAMWEQATSDGELSTSQRVSLFSAHVAAVKHSVSIINAMCEVTGTAAVKRAEPLGRVRRDAQALQGHISTNGAAIELAGKVRLGLLPNQVLV